MAREWATNTFEEYFVPAESEHWLSTFWGFDSIFRNTLEPYLDNSVVCEIACGWGRHSVLVAPRTKEFFGIDVSEANVRHTQNRLINIPQSKIFLTDGLSIPNIVDSTCDVVFCYDAMVHFEPNVVKAYLSEVHRVLKPGGTAILHHSNLPPSCGAKEYWRDNPGHRSPLDLNEFDSWCSALGCTLKLRNFVDWSGIPNLDALSVVVK